MKAIPSPTPLEFETKIMKVITPDDSKQRFFRATSATINIVLGMNRLFVFHKTKHVIRTLYNTIQYNTIQYNTIQYNTIQYNKIQYNKIQHDTSLLCPTLSCVVSCRSPETATAHSPASLR